VHGVPLRDEGDERTVMVRYHALILADVVAPTLNRGPSRVRGWKVTW
jgi:hypothetical protein